jgi:predicted GIY-YIG superfamily endonuclease
VSFTVYLLIGDDDKPFYVGATRDADRRVREHRNDRTVYDVLGGRTKHEATHRVELLMCTDEADMRDTEMRLIKAHRPVLNRNGNNAPTPAEQAKVDARIRELVDGAPEFSAEQVNKIRLLLHATPAS